jgi:hypothetical protein
LWYKLDPSVSSIALYLHGMKIPITNDHDSE